MREHTYLHTIIFRKGALLSISIKIKFKTNRFFLQILQCHNIFEIYCSNLSKKYSKEKKISMITRKILGRAGN